MHGFANFRKFKIPATLTLTLNRVKVISACTVSVVLTARRTICSATHYENMAVSMSWNVDIPRNLNYRDSFSRRKVENRAQSSCSPGPILSPTNISFELHAKVAKEIDLEMCSYGQTLEVQMLRDLDIDLGSGQGHINIRIMCRLPVYQSMWL